MNKELEKYFVIADTVQEANGDTCEVILYELTKIWKLCGLCCKWNSYRTENRREVRLLS